MPALKPIQVALVVSVLVLSGCGDDGGEVVADDTTTTADPDSTVSSPPATDGDTVPGVAWSRIEPTEDLLSPSPATPEELVVDPDDPAAVLVRFYGGVQECYGARATVVAETAERVVIRLETGARPDVGDVACIEIAEAQELRVELDAPVGDRRLIADAPRG